MRHLNFTPRTENNNKEKSLNTHNFVVITQADPRMYLGAKVTGQLAALN